MDRKYAIAKSFYSFRNGMACAQYIAGKIGYKPARYGILAISSTLRSMKKDELVFRIPPETQWDVAMWGLTPKGKEEYPHA